MASGIRDKVAILGMGCSRFGERWDADALDVGQPMRMMFRIKDIDTARGFRRYFWKAAPVGAKAKDRSKEA